MSGLPNFLLPTTTLHSQPFYCLCQKANVPNMQHSVCRWLTTLVSQLMKASLASSPSQR